MNHTQVANFSCLCSGLLPRQCCSLAVALHRHSRLKVHAINLCEIFICAYLISMVCGCNQANKDTHTFPQVWDLLRLTPISCMIARRANCLRYSDVAYKLVLSFALGLGDTKSQVNQWIIVLTYTSTQKRNQKLTTVKAVRNYNTGMWSTQCLAIIW